MSIQISLLRTMNASLSIIREIHSGDFSVQSIAQKTADIAAILGQASHELSLKQRVFIRSVINSEYKVLCSSSQPVTKFLFADNLPQVVKDLNLTNKLGSRPISKFSYSSPEIGIMLETKDITIKTLFLGETDQIPITNLRSNGENTRKDNAK